MIFKLSSPAFNNKERIPSKYTCSGSDLSPTLEWADTPQSTKFFALIMDDPDAPNGTWDHWVIYNIPSNITKLPEGKIDTVIKLANNSWGKKSYNGPCPPPGKEHRYFFKLYALDDFIELAPDANKHDLLEAINGHILAQTELIGIYSR
jgi:Raf kinase inhibitor-like YbhB/YbcL family protein